MVAQLFNETRYHSFLNHYLYNEGVLQRTGVLDPILDLVSLPALPPTSWVVWGKIIVL